MNRRGRAWLALSIGGLGLAWALTPMSGPPLYDGLILGNDLYRWVTPPPDHRRTPPPTAGRARVVVEAGALKAFTVGTKERPPQAQVAASSRAFGVPAGAVWADVTVTPIRPDFPPPPGDIYDGNVYRISVAADGRELAVLPGATVVAALRGTGMKGQPRFALRTAAGWTVGKPIETGTLGVYSLQIASVGDIALVLPEDAPTSSGGGFPTGAVASVAAFVVLLGVLLVVVRTRRSTAP